MNFYEPARHPPALIDRADAREMTAAERTVFLDRVYRQDALSAAELAPQRAKVFWRTTRALALVKGHMRPEQFLTEGLQDHPANWLQDPLGFEPHNGRLRVIGTDISDLLTTPTHLPLHPGRLTEAEALARLQQAHVLTAYHLGVTRFEDGQMGLKWMDAPDYFLALFPSTAAILDFERDFVDRAANVLLNKSPKVLSLWLRDVQGLSLIESRHIAALARRWVTEMHTGSQEERKAVMLARLHSVVARARKALDLKTELATLKQIAIVEGLGVLAAQDQQNEFIKLLQTHHEALPNAGPQPASGGTTGKFDLGVQVDSGLDDDGADDGDGGGLPEQD